uniref:Uncharacterized protein n=1 Tax=Opuntia streptacantha TaxID=393608 RepID=A0A7C9A940_OPUST
MELHNLHEICLVEPAIMFWKTKRASNISSALSFSSRSHLFTRPLNTPASGRYALNEQFSRSHICCLNLFIFSERSLSWLDFCSRNTNSIETHLSAASRRVLLALESMFHIRYEVTRMIFLSTCLIPAESITSLLSILEKSTWKRIDPKSSSKGGE